jgi:hypothetical protein
MTKPAPPPCPRCNGTDAVRYTYGNPDTATFEREKRHEIVMAGRVVWPGGPEFRCRKCGTDYTSDGKPAVTFEEFSKGQQTKRMEGPPTTR